MEVGRPADERVSDNSTGFLRSVPRIEREQTIGGNSWKSSHGMNLSAPPEVAFSPAKPAGPDAGLVVRV